ncbi:MAG TPA: lasso RiPP family leader peptide-containing protein [Solirubrobacteraceae bacterium]|nr:lasso RiPP family leader peptide-containing protein [Solirubrobacteraceae bacterium]
MADDERPPEYEPPKLIVLGSVADLTKALSEGSNIDFEDFLQSL